MLRRDEALASHHLRWKRPVLPGDLLCSELRALARRSVRRCRHACPSAGWRRDPPRPSAGHATSASPSHTSGTALANPHRHPRIQHGGLDEFMLDLPPTLEVSTLGVALFKRVQWKKDCILVSPVQQVSDKSLLEPPLRMSCKRSLQDIIDVSPSRVEREKSARKVGKGHSKNHTEGKKGNNKCTIESDVPPPMSTTTASDGHRRRAPKILDTTQEENLGAKKKRQQAGDLELTKSSNPVATAWTRPNSKFKFGQPMLSAKELKKAGLACAALHAYYMNECAEGRNTGIVGRVQRHYLWRESESDPLSVGFEDLFDLLTLDALDVAILRVLTLHLIVEARANSAPVGLLDPDALSIKTLRSNRDYSVAYLERCLKKYADEKFVMFAHNNGGHWVSVIIVPKWQKVLYLDSARGRKSDFSRLKSVIDEVYGNIQGKVKGQPKTKLIHATKIRCLQQGSENTCGFYVAHNLMVAMVMAKKLEKSEDFDAVSVPINMKDIREKIASFIWSQILDPKGEFYDAEHSHDD